MKKLTKKNSVRRAKYMYMYTYGGGVEASDDIRKIQRAHDRQYADYIIESLADGDNIAIMSSQDLYESDGIFVERLKYNKSTKTYMFDKLITHKELYAKRKV